MNYPRFPRNSFTIFNLEKRQELHGVVPKREIGNFIRSIWEQVKLNPEEHAIYRAKMQLDRLRFINEVEQYNAWMLQGYKFNVTK